jgi:hypothetical protein
MNSTAFTGARAIHHLDCVASLREAADRLHGGHDVARPVAGALTNELGVDTEGAVGSDGRLRRDRGHLRCLDEQPEA